VEVLGNRLYKRAACGYEEMHIIMSTQVTLPKLGDGIDEADVLEVFVNEGDLVKQGQNILEIETGKATAVIESTHTGTVSKIHVAAGQSVPVGGPLISVEAEEGAESAEPKAKEKPKAEKKPAEKPRETKAAKAEQKPEAEEPAEEKPEAEKKPAEKPAAEEDEEPATEAPKSLPKAKPLPTAKPLPSTAAQAAVGIVAAGPAIRRFAREVGVDLARVSGTGEGGRITREDVLEVVRRASKGQSDGAGQPAADVIRDDWGPIRYEKLSKMRQTIAAKMAESARTVPSVTNFDEADVTDLEHLRVTSKDDYAKKGIKLTSLPFVIKAVAMALRSHPAINASLDMEQNRIVYKDYVNIGVAVDTERGLVVPSLRGADELSIPEIARNLATLAESVRESKFTVDDLRGSTFTISNLGAVGGIYSTPIINVPEVAILLLGRSRQIPVVVEGEIEVRLMMPLSLTYDHRLVDGATAARFLNDVIGYLKAPSRLLLAL
jgi:pyruvate dehydrogenase E2 component (dihydrolipoamide acetyltransferase)